MTNVLIENDKGGVGKSLITQMLYIAARQNNQSPRLVEVETSSRLSHVVDRKSDYRHVAPPQMSPDEMYNNPDRAFDYWDHLAATISGQDAIVDLGANLAKPFHSWADQVGSDYYGDGADFVQVVVLTMESNSLSAGMQNLFDFGNVFPAARRIAVLNPLIAEFVEGDQRIAKMLQDATGNGREIEAIRIKRLAAPAWGYLMNLGRLDRVLNDLPQALRVSHGGKSGGLDFLRPFCNFPGEIRGAALRGLLVLRGVGGLIVGGLLVGAVGFVGHGVGCLCAV